MTWTVLVLLSGGIDSAACAKHYIARHAQVRSLFVDYGQAASRREEAAARAVAGQLSIPLQVVRIDGLPSSGPGRVQGRNLLLVSVGLMNFQESQGIIALGVHSGTDYEDCSESFIDAANAVADIYTGGSVLVRAPFIRFTKPEVWRYAVESEVPLHLTYSCERGGNQPCGHCTSCADLERLAC